MTWLVSNLTQTKWKQLKNKHNIMSHDERRISNGTWSNKAADRLSHLLSHRMQRNKLFTHKKHEQKMLKMHTKLEEKLISDERVCDWIGREGDVLCPPETFSQLPK